MSDLIERLEDEIARGKDNGTGTETLEIYHICSQALSQGYENVDPVVELITKNISPQRNQFLIVNLWHIVGRYSKTEDMSVPAGKILDWIRPQGDEFLSFIINGDQTPWGARDEHIIAGVPLFLDWCEKNNDNEMARGVLERIISGVVGTANREHTHAQELMDRVSPYFSPLEHISPNGGPRKLGWVWAWADSHFNAVKYEPCQDSVIRWLARWGVDMEAKNEDGKTVVEWALENYPGKGNEDPVSMIGHLVGAGAKWEDIYKNSGEQKKEILARVPKIRATLLGEVSKQVFGAGRKKDRPRLPGM